MESDSNRWFLCVRCQKYWKGSLGFLAHKNRCNLKLQRLEQHASKSFTYTSLKEAGIKLEMKKILKTKEISNLAIHEGENLAKIKTLIGFETKHRKETNVTLQKYYPANVTIAADHSSRQSALLSEERWKSDCNFDSRNSALVIEGAVSKELCSPKLQAGSGGNGVNHVSVAMAIRCENLKGMPDQEAIFDDDAEVKMLSRVIKSSVINSHATVPCDQQSRGKKSQTRTEEGPLRKFIKITSYFKPKSSLTDVPATTITTEHINTVACNNDMEHLRGTIQMLNAPADNDIRIPLNEAVSMDNRLKKPALSLQQNELQRHSRHHKENTVAKYARKSYKCSYCNKENANPHQLRTHMRNHTGEKPFSCRFCKANFSSSQGHKFHEETHLRDANYKDSFKHVCSLCGKKFRQPNDLTQHIRSHTGEKPIRCSSCSKTFATGGGKSHHERISHPTVPNVKDSFNHTCTVCFGKFMNPSKLAMHMRVHTGDRPYACKFCSKRFSQKSHHKAHLLSMHAGKFSSRKPSEKFMYHLNKCPFCSKMFYSKPDMERHVRRHNGEMPFTCRFCPIKFNLAGNRKRHEVGIHYKQMNPEELAKKPKCQCCKRPFYSNSEVRDHEKSCKSKPRLAWKFSKLTSET